MNRFLQILGVVALLLLLLMGCEPQSVSGPVDVAESPAATRPLATTATATGQPAAGTPTAAAQEPAQAAEAEAVEAARLALAQYLDVEAEAIETLSVEPVEWPDAALGCPLPGVDYAQVVTPGFRVELEAEGATYTYNTDREGRVMLCGEDGEPILPTFPVTPGEIDDGDPWLPADPPETNGDE